jgi:hypothetical protein
MVARWFDDDADRTPFLEALDVLRREATREPCCYHHVQAIVYAIDQYAEGAIGNLCYFMNRPPTTPEPKGE